MASVPLSLIVNADDLGMAAEINACIFRAIRDGMATTASLMTAMPYAADAARQWNEQTRGTGLGIHLTLTSGPAAVPERGSRLVDSNGVFKLGFAGLARMLYSSRRDEFLHEVAMEIDAQLAKADEFSKRYGIVFDHIDSHQHIHVLPGIGPLVASRAAARSLILRRPCERYGSWRRMARSFALRFPGGIGKKIVLDRFAARSLREKPRVGYFGIVDTGHVDRASLLAVLDVIPSVSRRTGLAVFEINLHPWEHDRVRLDESGYSDADRRFARAPGRTDEFRAVLDTAILSERMRKLGIQPVAFDRIGKEQES